MIKKKVFINGHEYMLTIKAIENRYAATLTTHHFTEARFVKTFHRLIDLRNSLKNWIIDCHKNLTNIGEKEVFESLEQWDGVIEI